jgi:hypothetical protein
MRYHYIIALDPSGNFNEGKGTTGCCIFNAKTNELIEAKSIYANAYTNQFDYWQAVLYYIIKASIKYKSVIAVVEDFMLYSTKATAQINSKMETPKLIGVLEYFCTEREIPLTLQPAHLVKNRWSEEVLLYKGYIQRIGRQWRTIKGKAIDKHAIDAIRHAVHYATFKNE